MPDHVQTPFDDLEPQAVLYVAEIAARLRVDERSVRRAIERGELRASRACGLRVLAADAAKWWSTRTVDSRLVLPGRSDADSADPSVRRGDTPRPARKPKRGTRRADMRLPLPQRGGGR
jgi:hypothetical protein